LTRRLVEYPVARRDLDYGSADVAGDVGGGDAIGTPTANSM
jgi:hypothetical protein